MCLKPRKRNEGNIKHCCKLICISVCKLKRFNRYRLVLHVPMWSVVKCIVYKVIKLSLKSDTHSCFVSQGNVSSQVNITEAGKCDSTLQYMFWFEESREVSFLTNAQRTLHLKDKYNVKILIAFLMSSSCRTKCLMSVLNVHGKSHPCIKCL